MDKHAKIVVFGESGLVGNAILNKLYNKGYVNLIGTYYTKKIVVSSDIDYVKINLINQKEVNDFFNNKRPDYVFFAAGKVGGIIANNTYKADFIYNNIMMAANVIHASYKFGVKKLLNLGSSCIYPKYAKQPMKEEYLLTGLLEPTNEPYAIAKISAIKLCRYFNEQYKTNFISVMPTNLYGPNDNFDLINSHVLPALLRKFHLAKLLAEKKFDEIIKDLKLFGNFKDIYSENEKLLEENLNKLGIFHNKIKLWGSGNPYREFLYVDDMADACVYIMENFNAKDIGEFVNIGTGKDIKIQDIADIVKKIVGFKGDIEWDISKPDGTPKKLLDITKLEKLGWKPRIDLNTGISQFYKWYLKKF